MSYPENTSLALHAMGYTPEIDYSVGIDAAGAVQIDVWSHADPQPTDADVLSYLQTQAFLDWLAEYGGDPALTVKREARELVDGDDRLARVILAVVQGVLDQVRAEVPGVIDPTPAQIRNFIKNAVDAG